VSGTRLLVLPTFLFLLFNIVVDVVTFNIEVDVVIFNIGVDVVIFNIGVDVVIFNIGVDVVIFKIGVGVVIFNIGVDVVIFNIGVHVVIFKIGVDVVIFNIIFSGYRCTKYKVIIQKVVKRYKSDSAVKQEVVNCSNRMHRAVTSLDPDRKYGAADEQQPNVLYMEELSARPFWSEAEFVSDIAVLESHVQEIREEFENVYNTVWPDGWLVNNTSSGEWAVYHLFNQGAPIPSNCQKCPKTCAVLRNLVSSMSNSGNLFGNVSFSVVQSSTHISPHYGPTNVRIRCHLGLRISDPRTSYMVVNGERCGWESGKCLLFDDSFLHEVHHRDVDGAARAVLLIDLWHPETTHEERQLIDNLFKFEKASFPSIPTISMQIPASNDL